MKTLIIVGSAPLEKDFSKFIDNCDCVVRFNNCKNYGGFSGTRTDSLFLSNSGDPAIHKTLSFMLEDRTPEQVRRDLPYVYRAGTIWFTRPPGRDLVDHLRIKIPDSVPMKAVELEYNCHGRDLATEIVRSLKIPEKKIRMVAPAFHSAIWGQICSLGPTNAVLPSTGIVGIETVLRNPQFADYKQKYLVGFGWEGWIGHPWDLERRLVEDYLERGLLREAPDINCRLSTRIAAGLGKLVRSRQTD